MQWHLIIFTAQQQQQQQQSTQKHDIFVGNLAFNTSEDQLHQAFSEIGRVLKVRLVTDQDTGKPRGFAFIEYEDPQAALSAIRNMNDYELNGRRIRVNFSNSSHLEALAGKLGMDLSQQSQQRSSTTTTTKDNQSGAGTMSVADALKGMSKGEMYDVVAKFKEIADRDADEARRLLSGHPQLPEAMLFLMSKLDMVQTSIATAGGVAAGAPSVLPAAEATRAADPRARVDPRAAAQPATAAAAIPSDPRSGGVAAVPAAPRADPRARVDPRAAARTAQPPPVMMQPPQPPPYTAVTPQVAAPVMQAPPPGLANLDPSLVQQVMSLTPQQIAQLPPNKQQSILALRQQITGAGM